MSPSAAPTPAPTLYHGKEAVQEWEVTLTSVSVVALAVVCILLLVCGARRYIRGRQVRSGEPGTQRFEFEDVNGDIDSPDGEELELVVTKKKTDDGVEEELDRILNE